MFISIYHLFTITIILLLIVMIILLIFIVFVTSIRFVHHYLFCYDMLSSLCYAFSSQTHIFSFVATLSSCQLTQSRTCAMPRGKCVERSVWPRWWESWDCYFRYQHKTADSEKQIPSGKHTQNYGKSPFLNIFNGKAHYKWPFSIAMSVITRG